MVSTLKGLGAPKPAAISISVCSACTAPKRPTAVQSCDLLIAVGARFDDRVTGKLDTFAPHASVIHIDIDPAELNKLRRAHVSLQGDLNRCCRR